MTSRHFPWGFPHADRHSTRNSSGRDTRRRDARNRQEVCRQRQAPDRRRSRRGPGRELPRCRLSGGGRAHRRRRRCAGGRHRAQGARPDAAASLRSSSPAPCSSACSIRSTPRPSRPARKTGVTGFALESLPRISRAQAMDVLSSQANIAGYKAVIIAANEYGKFLPMLMTAAGTVKAARVLVMGVGVAGLQAIATAKRLGAVIEASDVRPVGEGPGRVARRQVDGRSLRERRGAPDRRRRRRLRAADAARVDGAPGRHRRTSAARRWTS